MSNTAWALQVMIKYRLIVDFSRRTIEDRGFDHYWHWNDDDVSFYDALQIAIIDIERDS